MADQDNTAITRIIDGWTLDVTSDEPRIRDVELAERAGLKKPRNIRQLIERSREELQEFGPLDMRLGYGRISKPRGGFEEREVREFWLTEHQALAVLLQLRTLQARRLRGVVVRLFVAVRRGQLPAPQHVPVPVMPNVPTLGDRLYRADVKARCAMTARCTGASVQRIHGWLRKLYKVSGIYQINHFYHEQVCGHLEALALGRLLLPPTSAPRQLKSVPDPAQRVLQFPSPPA